MSRPPRPPKGRGRQPAGPAEPRSGKPGRAGAAKRGQTPRTSAPAKAGKAPKPRTTRPAPKADPYADVPEWRWTGDEPEADRPPRRGRPRQAKAAEEPARPQARSAGPAGQAPRRRADAEPPPRERWREERRKRPTPEPDQCRYVAFHKPYGVLSQFTPEGRWRGLGEFGLPPGVYAAGRLDADSEGLLLLTDDGPLIKRLLDPKHGHPRTYLAQVEGEPDEAALAALAAGPVLSDGPTRPCEVELLAEEPELPPRDPPIRFRKSVPTAWLRLTLTEGRNRQVRRMTAAVGHPTLRLVRVAIGDLTLGELAPGTWTTVDRNEILSGLR
ncbi:pseudouridine synthase [Inquilinus limosus]|uniref:pseudouridine synthase n=1 Tax=Inquilinus limosus TaxID=171674 RepID=UPI003F184F22